MALSPSKRREKERKRLQKEAKATKSESLLGAELQRRTKAEGEAYRKLTRGWTASHMERAGALQSGRFDPYKNKLKVYEEWEKIDNSIGEDNDDEE